MLTNINHITLAVSNLERSFNFYKNILGFKPICRWHEGAYFLVGDFWFCLNVDPDLKLSMSCTHYAFSVLPENFKLLSERIMESKAIIFKENTSSGDSVYFLDPDGHKLEIHVGNWQNRADAKKKNIGDWLNVEWFV